MKFFILSFMLFAKCSFALISPYHQEAIEIKTILNSTEFHQLVHSNEIIQKIEKIDDGYLIQTTSSLIRVEVTYQQNTTPGPAQFTLSYYISNELDL